MSDASGTSEITASGRWFDDRDTDTVTAPDGRKFAVNSEHVRGEGRWWFIDFESARGIDTTPDWARDADLGSRTRATVVRRLQVAYDRHRGES